MKVVAVVLLTLLSAVMEAKGYLEGFRSFPDQQHRLLTAFLWYSGGILLDFGCLYLLSTTTFYKPELLACFFIATTMIGIALLNGQLFTWSTLDQLVAVVVVLGLSWLAYRLD